MQAIHAEAGVAIVEPVKKSVAASKEVPPVMGNFTRTTKRRTVMVQEMRKLIWTDGVKFPAQPILDPTTDIIHSQAQLSIDRTAFLGKVFDFFSNYFVETRSPDIFALKVFEWLRKCGEELSKDPPRRKHLQELVSMIATCEFAKDRALPSHEAVA